MHTGLGVGMAAGSESGAEKHVHKCPQAKCIYNGKREGNSEGLFNWWWVGEKQRQEKKRGSAEWRKKVMRSSEKLW